MPESHSVDLPSSIYSKFDLNLPDHFVDRVQWVYSSSGDIPILPADYFPAGYTETDRRLSGVYLREDGGVSLWLGSGSSSHILPSIQATLSLTFTLSHGGTDYTLTVSGLPGTQSSPIQWIPENSDQVTALYNALPIAAAVGVNILFNPVQTAHAVRAASPSGGTVGSVMGVSVTPAPRSLVTASAPSGGTAAGIGDADVFALTHAAAASAPSGGTGGGISELARAKASASAATSGGSASGSSATVRGVATRASASTSASGGVGAGSSARKLTPSEPLHPENIHVIDAGQTYIVLAWDPPLGDGESDIEPVTDYEISIDNGPWLTIGHVLVYRLTTLGDVTVAGGNSYLIRLRARNSVGAGTSSAPRLFRSGAVDIPSPPLFPSARPVSDSLVVLEWQPPADLGGGVLERYEVSVTHPDGRNEPFEPTDSLDAEWMVRGLAEGERYGFRVRVANQDEISAPTAIVFATPRNPVSTPLVAGQALPILPIPVRQSMIIRLENVDCRLSVWWQPWDEAWYASFEAPVNTPVVASRRLAVNSGLLDRVSSSISGNIVVRALDSADDRVEPGRNAWSDPSHGLFYVI